MRLSKKITPKSKYMNHLNQQSVPNDARPSDYIFNNKKHTPTNNLVNKIESNQALFKKTENGSNIFKETARQSS